MYCMVEIKENRFTKVWCLSANVVKEIKDALENTAEVLGVFESGLYIKDALKDLELWARTANQGGEFLKRNIHTAERLCRGFLFEFKTYLDHLETTLVRNYGKDSELYKLFKDSTHKAYDTCAEYAFTYQLRNYSQHCKNVVHSFNCEDSKPYLQPACNPDTLLKEYKKWKNDEKEFILSFSGNIDLQNVFEKVHDAIGIIQTPIINYILNNNNVSVDIKYLRNLADLNYGRENIAFQHFTEIRHKDGRDATMEDYKNNVPDLVFNVRTIDWNLIYDFTDCMGIGEN